MYALVTDGEHPEMVQTPMLSAAEIFRSRGRPIFPFRRGHARRRHSRDEIRNYASEWREHNRYTNDAQREQELRDELKERFAELLSQKCRFSASPDASKPVGVVTHIAVPNYTQRTGKRLFVRPDYFASGHGSLFTENIRYNNIYFEFPWSEFDTVELKAAHGFCAGSCRRSRRSQCSSDMSFTGPVGLDQA